MGNFISEDEDECSSVYVISTRSSVSVRRNTVHVETEENALFTSNSQVVFRHQSSSATIPRRALTSSPFQRPMSALVASPLALPQRRVTSAPFRSRFEETGTGSLICKRKCLFIGSYGDEYPKGLKIARKVTVEKKIAYLPQITEDLRRLWSYSHQDPFITLEDTYVYKDEPNKQCSKEYYLREIANFLTKCEHPGAMIWYTGHGEKDSGDWVFSTGTISFSEIYDLYEKHFHGKLLYIVTDCCYSGQWVQRLAEYLTSQQIGACGHCTRYREVLIKVFAACLPHEPAYDGAYSGKGVIIDDKDHHLSFLRSKIEVKGYPGQTPCFLDSTKVCCCNSPQEKCNWLSIPEGTNWNWSQLADADHRRSIFNRVRLVRGEDRGKPVWRYVLVKSHLLKEYFETVASGSINVADYGHVLCRGWGTDPPEHIKNKFSKFSALYSTS